MTNELITKKVKTKRRYAEIRGKADMTTLKLSVGGPNCGVHVFVPIN